MTAHIRELFDLSGRVAIVTGGSRGLGREMAEGLAEAGASVMLCAQAAGREMLKREYGRIVNVSSVSGLQASVEGPHYAGYAASKAGLLGLTRELAASWGRQGIRVNAIAPGFFHSRLADPAIQYAEPDLQANSPIPRVGEAGELKGVAVFLAADASNYVTGQVVAVDGGRSI